MNLFSISLKLKGFPIKKAKQTLESIQKKTRIEFETYLIQQRQEIIAYHLKHNLFYKGLAKNATISDWNSIPIITKKDLQQPLNERLSLGFTAKNCLVNNTSGSSGEPLIFAKDKFSHALSWSIFMDRYRWYNLDLNTSKQARFYGIPLNKMGYYKERLKDRLGHRFRFSVSDMSDAQLAKNVTLFKTSSFEYLYGYSNALALFGKYLKRKNIILKTVCPTLKVCIATSENLFENDKQLLEQQFGIPVVNEYGAAEVGLIAFQNQQNEWCINSDDLFVEILDDDDNPLAYGKKGRVIITSLHNKAHPFIRYDIGDIGVLSENSTLQKPILKALSGRTNDTLKFPSGKTAAGFTMYYVTKTIIDEASKVKEFMIEQLQLDTFKVSYASEEEFSEAQKNKIKKAFDRLEPGLIILFERKEALERKKSGKAKQFISYVN